MPALDTADRLLGGTLDPDAAPPACRDVARLVAALRAPTAADPVNEAQVVAHMTAIVASSSAPTRWSRRATILAVTAGGLLVGGLAAAGALPGASGPTPSVETPVPNANAGEHPNTRGKSADHVPTSVPPDTNAVPRSAPPEGTKGAEISTIAHDPALQGLEKGAAVSDAASGGASHAGEDHGPPASGATPPGLPPQATGHHHGP
jgi:hypothetical protein